MMLDPVQVRVAAFGLALVAALVLLVVILDRRVRQRRWMRARDALEHPTGPQVPAAPAGPPLLVRLRERFGKPGVMRQLTLMKRRDVDVKTVETAIVHRDHGAYVVDAESIFELREWLPPGPIIVHVEGNPEALRQAGEPKGFNAKFLGIVTGNYPLHLMGAGYASPPTGLSARGKTLLALGGLLLLALAALAYLGKKAGWF